MITQAEAVHRAAEFILEQARECGRACGISDRTEAVMVLEEALALATVEVIMFQGANDTPERVEEAIRINGHRWANQVRYHHFLRRGGKPT